MSKAWIYEERLISNMNVRKRYRASFNFLEYPRIVIALRQRADPIRDISFSTRHPEEILSLFQEAISARR